MLLYHCCDESAYAALQKRGYLTGDGRRADRNIRDLDTRPYHWMAEQMRKRLPPKPKYAGAFPVWAWHTHNGKRMADLRSRDFAPMGKRYVRLTVDVPSELVLLSDEEDWHAVLSGCFHADTEAEWNLWNEREKSWPPEQYQAAMRASWEKIFDIEREQDPDWGRPGPRLYIQACFWVLEKNMVRKERWFIGRQVSS